MCEFSLDGFSAVGFGVIGGIRLGGSWGVKGAPEGTQLPGWGGARRVSVTPFFFFFFLRR